MSKEERENKVIFKEKVNEENDKGEKRKKMRQENIR